MQDVFPQDLIYLMLVQAADSPDQNFSLDTVSFTDCRTLCVSLIDTCR